MNRTRCLILLLALVTAVVLVGCGNKGDLVRPSAEPEAPASA